MNRYRIAAPPPGWWVPIVILVLLAFGRAAAGASEPAGSALAESADRRVAGVRIVIDGARDAEARYTAMAEALIGLAPGDPLTAQAIRTSTEQLRLSRRFAAIHVDATPRSDGEVVVFTLTPFRHIRNIRIRGNNPIFEQEVLNQMTLYVGDPFSDADLDAQAEAIVRRFKRAGYIAPRVSVKAVDEDADGTVVLDVDIDKGACYRPGMVTFSGNRAISARMLKWRLETWRSVLLFGSGRFSEFRLKQDLDRLTQYYHRQGFADAGLTYRIDRIGADGRVDVTITVREGPRYRVVFAGNHHFWDLTLDKDIVIFSDGNRNDRGVKKSIRNLKRRYHDAGFADVAITVQKSTRHEATAEDIELRFTIAEGPRTIVEAVVIRGNAAISDKAIREQILTRPPDLLHSGAFNPRTLDADLYAVTILYMREGFQERTVTSDLAFSKDRTAVTVTLNITEGPRTLVRHITIQGQTVLPEARIREALVHRTGAPFRQTALDAEKEAIASRVAEAGYPHARVDSDVRFSEDLTAADIVLTIVPGPRVILGDIFISGNLITDPDVIRRELGVRPGSPLALQTLYDGQRQLRDLDIFDSVDYRIFGLKERAETVNLFVDVRERKPYYVQASTGYESDTGLFGRIKAGDRNLFGRNKELWGSAGISETGYRVESQLSEPRFLGTRTTAAVGVFHDETTEFNQSFGTRTTGGSLHFDRSLGNDLTAALGFTVEKRRQFIVDAQAADTIDETPRTVFVTTPSLLYDSRDSFVRPTRGIYSSISVDLSKGAHHQIDDFIRYQFDNRVYHRILDGVTLAALARIGQVASYAGQSDVPEDQLFYLGGIQNVRGYKENLLRFDAAGNAVGGRTALVGSLEARIDLGMNVELTTFFDIGSVQDAMVDAGSDAYRSSVGLGLRYITPIGPIGLLYGHKLDRQPGESSGRFHLSIGYSF